MSSKWEDNIMLHDYPECGPGSISIEQLYRMFKRRMENEQVQEEDEAEQATARLRAFAANRL